LYGSEWHVEQRCLVLVLDEGVQDQRPERIRDRGSHVQEKRHRNPEICFRLEENFNSLVPLEFAGSDTSLVGSQTFDGLGALCLGEESGGCHAVVEFPVDEGSRDDGDEADEKEDAN
jgi:hypothetical protein